MKQAKNSLQLPKCTADTRKIQNVGSGEKKMQIKTILFITCVVKVKPATSAHSIYS